MNTLRKSMNVMVLISDNIDKLNLTEYQGVMETPRGDKTVSGFITNLLEVSKINLEIFFITDDNPTWAYDEDSNRLYLPLVPGNNKEGLITKVKNEIQLYDQVIHELTHYFDWSEGTIEKLEFSNYTEYVNSTPEINAHINQGIYNAMNNEDDYPSIDTVITYLPTDFYTALTAENKIVVREKIKETLSTFNNIN